MRARLNVIALCLLLAATAGGALWWATHREAPSTGAPTPPGITEPGSNNASGNPPGTTTPGVTTPGPAAVCPSGGDATIAVAGPATARCTALPVIKPLRTWQPLDPDPTLPTYSHPEPTTRSQYQLDLIVAPSIGQIDGQMRLAYTNDSTQPLDSLYFHLFPNAPYFTENWEGKVARPGALAVSSVTIGGQAIPFTGGTEEILSVSLPTPLQPGAQVELSLTYRVIVPTIENDRFGTDGRTLFLGNAYPTLAMHDQAGWHLDRYIAVGDPFYSEVADYTVTVQVPQGYDVAATGRGSRSEERFTFVAERVRDFGLAVGSRWSRHEREVDGVRLHYLHDVTLSGPSPELILDHMAGSLRFFSQRFGPYPYQDLTVVDRVGMEYPQFIMGGPDLHTVIHEVAHQWWYGIVGNDELRQIWDEGLTEFSALLYEASVGLQTPASRLTIGDLGAWSMDDSLYRYAAAQDRGQLSYGQVIYRRGWRFWEALRQELGDQRFLGLVQSFYQSHQFGNATWSDWRQAVVALGDEGAVDLFDQWVYGVRLPASLPTRVAPLVD